jgi:hypothetical protein
LSQQERADQALPPTMKTASFLPTLLYYLTSTHLPWGGKGTENG